MKAIIHIKFKKGIISAAESILKKFKKLNFYEAKSVTLGKTIEIEILEDNINSDYIYNKIDKLCKEFLVSEIEDYEIEIIDSANIIIDINFFEHLLNCLVNQKHIHQQDEEIRNSCWEVVLKYGMNILNKNKTKDDRIDLP